jgi:hypothetical protein
LQESIDNIIKSFMNWRVKVNILSFGHRIKEYDKFKNYINTASKF